LTGCRIKGRKTIYAGNLCLNVINKHSPGKKTKPKTSKQMRKDRAAIRR